MTTIELLERLGAVRWSWELEGAQKCLEGIGAVLEKRKPNRISYSCPGTIGVELLFWECGADRIRAYVRLFEMTDEILDSGDSAAYDAVWADFEKEFRSVVNEASKFLGEPYFEGSVGSDDFPLDSPAVNVARWLLPSCKLSFELEHQDKEVPIILVVVILPPG